MTDQDAGPAAVRGGVWGSAALATWRTGIAVTEPLAARQHAAPPRAAPHG